MKLYVRCSELRIFVNNFALWKRELLEKTVQKTFAMKIGTLSHLSVSYAIQTGTPIKRSIRRAERFLGIKTNAEQRKKIYKIFKRVEKLGVDKVEVFVKSERHKLVGKVDMLKRSTPVEIKFGRFTEGDLYQLGAYMICLNTNKGFLLYPEKTLYFEFEGEIMRKIESKVRECLHMKYRFLGCKNEYNNRNLWMFRGKARC